MTSYPKTLNDFRPVALTSLVMKCFEKFVRDELLLKTQNLLDLLQFAYQARRGVEDASSALLKGSYDAFFKDHYLCIWCNRIC